MAPDLPTFDIAEDAPETTPPILAHTNKPLDVDEPAFRGSTLSPFTAHFPAYVTRANSMGSPQRVGRMSPYSPSFGGSSDNDLSGSNAPSESDKQPFGFTPQQYVVGRPPAALAEASKQQQQQAELGRRRGHKYARSSVSHQIILSPTPRLPLQLPTSLPLPTFKEFRASMTSTQRGRWLFCAMQLLVAGYVQWQAHGSMAMTALSHLLFFDAVNAILCNAMDVGRNFEAWTRSSLRNPFGLERSELVAGLTMSIVLLFMGLDLVSHGLTHSLENAGGHVAHHSHTHDHSSHVGTIDIAALAAILSTIISASTEGSNARIGRAIRPSQLPSWVPQILRNPSHVLTLSCATLLLLLPLLSIPTPRLLDTCLSLAIALAMIILGARLCFSIGRVLLMSFPARDSAELRELVAEVWDGEGIAAVDEAKVWQVHYGLCMANFRVRVRKGVEVVAVRERIERIVRRRLAGGSGGRVKWEISSMIEVDRD